MGIPHAGWRKTALIASFSPGAPNRVAGLAAQKPYAWGPLRVAFPLRRKQPASPLTAERLSIAHRRMSMIVSSCPLAVEGPAEGKPCSHRPIIAWPDHGANARHRHEASILPIGHACQSLGWKAHCAHLADAWFVLNAGFSSQENVYITSLTCLILFDDWTRKKSPGYTDDYCH